LRFELGVAGDLEALHEAAGIVGLLETIDQRPAFERDATGVRRPNQSGAATPSSFAELGARALGLGSFNWQPKGKRYFCGLGGSNVASPLPMHVINPLLLRVNLELG